MKRIIILLSILTISNSKLEYCDIKGNVVNPGVYKIEKNMTIQDVINKSGGLKNDSYTDNINLSKKVTDEMVIYINTKQEINRLKALNNCDCSNKYVYIECEKTTKKSTQTTKQTTKNTNEIKTTTKKIPLTTSKRLTTRTKKTTSTTTTTRTTKTNDEVKLININTCSKEDLTTLNGLGIKKAEKIIEYRNTNGNFETIEDIMKVSGIGKVLFETIKEYIEV